MLTSQVWFRTPFTKSVQARRINQEVRFRAYNRISHLLAPPTLVRRMSDGSLHTMTPACAVRKNKKSK